MSRTINACTSIDRRDTVRTRDEFDSIPGPGDTTERARVPESVLNESIQDANSLRVIADLLGDAADNFPSLHCRDDQIMVDNIRRRLAEFSRGLSARSDEIEDDNA